MVTLKGLTTDNNYTLKEAERLRRIDAIYKEISDQYSFAKHFYNETILLVGQRTKEQKQIEGLMRLFPIQH